MLPITGYVDRWSVRPGEPIRFMIGVQGGGRYRARVVRVICGDPNPAGAGYREVPVAWDGEGEHEGEEQHVALGSWVDVPRLDLGAVPGLLTFAATVWPTRIAAGEQAVLSWTGAGGTLTLGLGPNGAFCQLATATETHHVETGVSATETGLVRRVLRAGLGQWPDGRAAGPAQGTPGPGRDGPAHVGAGAAAGPVRAGAGSHSGRVARRRDLVPFQWQDRAATHHGRGRGSGQMGLGAIRADDEVIDAGPHGFHGRCVNLPTRAMTGSNWRGNVHRWTEDPAQYGATHFHDDVGDAGWRSSICLTVPEDRVSGVYALHLEQASEARDNIVFYVRAKVPGSQAKVAFLAPTFTYTVYGQYQKDGRQALITPCSLQWGALPQAPDGIPNTASRPTTSTPTAAAW